MKDKTYFIFLISLGVWICLLVGTIFFFTFDGYINPEHTGKYQFNQWCQSQGYEYGKGLSVFSEAYCEKIINNTIYRRYIGSINLSDHHWETRYKFIEIEKGAAPR